MKRVLGLGFMIVSILLVGLGWFFRSSPGGGGSVQAQLAVTKSISAKSDVSPRFSGSLLGSSSGGSSMPSFSRAGWSEVQVPEPDPEVLALTPGEKGRAREGEILAQLRSAVLQDDQVPAAASWVRDSRASSEVRTAALEALGRSRSPAAQAELVHLLESPVESPEGSLPDLFRRRALELVHGGPELDSPATLVLLRILTRLGAPRADREQAAYSLALAAQLHPGLRERVLARVSDPEARALLGEALGRVGGASP